MHCTSVNLACSNHSGVMSAPTNQPRTILGPLTMTWITPASCSVAVQNCQICNLAWAGQSCFASTCCSSVGYGFEDFTDCLPPGSVFVSVPTPPLEGWGFYSPCLSCPYGMTAGHSATGGGSSGCCGGRLPWDVFPGIPEHFHFLIPMLIILQ